MVILPQRKHHYKLTSHSPQNPPLLIIPMKLLIVLTNLLITLLYKGLKNESHTGS